MTDTHAEDGAGQGLRGAAVAVPALVLLADALFWTAGPGLSLVVFAGAVVGVVALQARRLAMAAPVVFALGALPVVEHVQALSLAFLLAGTLGALAIQRNPGATPAAHARVALRLLARLPLGGLRNALDARHALASAAPRQGLRGLLQGWGLPVGGTLVFAALMVDANPLIARAFTLDVDLFTLATRLLFWGGVALVCLPLIDRAPLPDAIPPVALRPPGVGVNAASTLRALVLFNAVIGVQTGLDLTILTGSADLPPGISHAAYAHRGAYPLLATALLAGAFALLAQPFLLAHRLIRPLMLLWLAQNVALCLSAMLRLDLYVGAFGLTYLRVWAMIWIALVAAGLALTGWQVMRGLPRGWLMARVGAMGVATLYACCFINFAHIIAAQNLTRPGPDAAYLCDLGPTAAGAFVPPGHSLRDLPTGAPRPCGIPRLSNAGWRDWEFRSWRVRRYIGAAQEDQPHDRSDRG